MSTKIYDIAEAIAPRCSVVTRRIDHFPEDATKFKTATALHSVLRNICLLIIDGHFLICGVDLRSSPSKSLRKIVTDTECCFRTILALLFRLLTLFSIVFYFIGKSIRINNELQSSLNINKIFFIWYVFIAGLLFIEIICCHWFSAAVFRQILNSSRNLQCLDCKRVLYWVLCLSVWTTVDIYLLISNQQTRGLSQATNDEKITDFWKSFRFVSERCEVFLFQTQHNCYLFFLIGPRIIKRRLEKLNENLADRSLDHILELKEDIRSTTSAFNTLFRRIGSFIYLKVVAVGYRIVILLTTPNQPIRRIQILNSCLQFAILYDMASAGTEIINLCRSLPALFIAKQKSKLSHGELFTGSTELSYDMTQDAVTISNCYTNEKATILTYVCTVVTSIAILLQFDYNIMAQFDELKASNKHHEDSR